jgi:hypothetical protein
MRWSAAIGRGEEHVKVFERRMSEQSPSGEPAATGKTGGRYTLTAIGLNLLLLAMIAYGYVESRDLKWAWITVAVPIAVVTVTYIRHWFKQQ